MEETITAAIVDSFFKKLKDHLALDVAIVGAGPSGIIAAYDLARAGKRVAVFERKLAPGGGVWGGGMLFNEIVFQDDLADMLDEFGITHAAAGKPGYITADSVETAAALIYRARHAGAVFFNAVSVEDIMVHDDRVRGVVVNWTPVERLGMHVDPLVFTARAVVDGTGHPSEIANLAARKAGIKLNTPTGEVMGEKPMWMESGEASTVENTKQLYPGLYASGMAANNIMGGFRMGPIFGGMFRSGRKIAQMIMEDLDG